MINKTYIIESIVYTKGSSFGRLNNDIISESGVGKVVIFDKYQKFNKLKQGNIITSATIRLTHKKKYCIATIVAGEFINSKNDKIKIS